MVFLQETHRQSPRYPAFLFLWYGLRTGPTGPCSNPVVGPAALLLDARERRRHAYAPMERFVLSTQYAPAGDQPAAIAELVAGLERGDRHQTLLGITGSGKTFTIANVIATLNRPALVMAPNKTLAAQLYSEMRELFPNNAVEYFVSYYDYYQPEAYIPSSDTYIEKDSILNEKIDQLRHGTTRSLLSRHDVIIVASVSCIYGIGSAEWYDEMTIRIERGEHLRRDELLRRLVD